MGDGYSSGHRKKPTQLLVIVDDSCGPRKLPFMVVFNCSLLHAAEAKQSTKLYSYLTTNIKLVPEVTIRDKL